MCRFEEIPRLYCVRPNSVTAEFHSDSILLDLCADVVEAVEKATQVEVEVAMWNSTQVQVEKVLFEAAKTTSSKSKINRLSKLLNY